MEIALALDAWEVDQVEVRCSANVSAYEQIEYIACVLAFDIDMNISGPDALH